MTVDEDRNWEWDGRPPEELSPHERWLAQANPKYQREHMSPEERQKRAEVLKGIRAMGQYRRAVQRELYAKGRGKVYMNLKIDRFIPAGNDAWPPFIKRRRWSF